MRRDRPDGPTLAALARAAAVAGEAAALVARAVAIAEREAAAGDAPLEASRRALADLYGPGALGQLLRCFAEDIRVGRFDDPGPARERALGLLWAITRQKLAEANPDYLAAADLR